MATVSRLVVHHVTRPGLGSIPVPEQDGTGYPGYLPRLVSRCRPQQ